VHCVKVQVIQGALSLATLCQGAVCQGEVRQNTVFKDATCQYAL
jgi:hypothetical protein